MATVLGTSVKRREDPALITGEGKFTDDFVLPGLAHAAVVRSPHAHAKIVRIDASSARQLPGVLAVYTAEDIKKAGIPGVVPVCWLLPGMKTPPHPLLAGDTVRHVGDGIAVVVATDRYVAPTPSISCRSTTNRCRRSSSVVKAIEAGAPQIHADAPGNVCFEWELGDSAKTEAAFASAPRKVTLHLRNNRTLAHAMEPRSALASWDEHTGMLTLRMTSQNPHVHRLLLTLASIGLPEHRIRVIAPEVGGGFGSKIHHYPDEALAAFCAMQLKRPVKWTATRSETNQTDAHGRDHVTDAELALDNDGHILGLRVRTLAALGGYLSTFAPAIPTYLYGTLLSGQYAIPAIHVHVTGVFTTTTPVDAVRGAGRPEATFVIERLVDMAAGELKMDPARFAGATSSSPTRSRSRPRSRCSTTAATTRPRSTRRWKWSGISRCGPSRRVAAVPAAGCWASASPPISKHAASRRRRWSAPSAPRRGCGRARRCASIRPERSRCSAARPPRGRATRPRSPRSSPSKLGIDMDKVHIVHGDTDQVQFGMGTYGSRSAAVGGSAIAASLEKILVKGKRIAAHLLEASHEDIEYEDGRFAVRGAPARNKAWGDVVLQAYLAHNLPADVEPGLEATSFYNPSNFTFPFGTHIAVVEIVPDTGEVHVVRYVAVDDVGNVINPMIVEGQLHGGIVHGIGQALFEEVLYDDSGQLLTTTLMDYAVPKAHQVLSLELGRTVTPCPHNPLGVKGVGEAGAIAAPAAVVNAVVDALGPFGVRHLDMPLTAEKVWRAMQEGRRS